MPMPYGMFNAPVIDIASYKLTIELVPERQWGVNLRAMMSETQWGSVRSVVCSAANGRCAICGGLPGRSPLECHEVWAYDKDLEFTAGRRTQKLTGLQALCRPCHRVKHLGFADKQGWLEASIDHLARVNGISPGIARAYVKKAYEEQRRRATMVWKQDISWFIDRFPGKLRSERDKANASKQSVKSVQAVIDH